MLLLSLSPSLTVVSQGKQPFLTSSASSRYLSRTSTQSLSFFSLFTKHINWRRHSVSFSPKNSAMNFFLLTFFLLLSVLGNFGTAAADSDPQCYARYYFALTCHHFSFGGHCQPWQLSQCSASRISHHELRCPRWFCVSYNSDLF